VSALPAGAVEHALRVLFPQPDPYAQDPVAWNRDKRGGYLWSKQREIRESVRDHRYTAVHSCHDAGKSYVAADAIAWWIDTHPEDEVFAVWTAPTYAQVNAIIGRELRAAHAEARLPGRVTLDNRWIIGDRLVGYGRKPADTDTSAFQGIHAKYVLVVIDEAGGVDKPMWDAVDALVTNEHARVLAIGNPDDPESHFARVCEPGSKEGAGWNVIHVDGLHTPNFTSEPVPDRLRPLLLSPTWVQERRERWGEESPLFIAKVRGLFAKGAEDAMIPAPVVAAARRLEQPASAPEDPVGGVLGCDVARDGGDMNTIISIFKGRAEIVDEFHEADLTRTADRIIAELEDRGPLWKAVIDGDGLGAGVVDIARRRGAAVVEFRGAEKARRKPHRFRNRRAEAWWGARMLLKDGLIVLPGAGQGDRADDLAADLSAPKRVTDSDGRTGVERKEDIRKRLGRSPDLGDALVMAASEEPDVGPVEVWMPHADVPAVPETVGLMDRAL
jgi:hypothetical protein